MKIIQALIKCASQPSLGKRAPGASFRPLIAHPGPGPAPGLTGGARPTLARREKEGLSPNSAHTRGRSNIGPEGTRLRLRARPRNWREDRQEPAWGEAGEAAGPRPHQAAKWPYAASRPRLRAKPQGRGLLLPGRVPAAPSSWRFRPTFCSASGPPRSDSGPASPGSFKLTSDRYRGMGEAEREPSTSERDTEKPEVERRAREPDGKTRMRPEIPEVNRRRRTPLPGSCRGVPETTERDPKRLFLFSATPSPTHATPRRPLGRVTPNR